ncbi:hypothetical protein H6P81_000009 [Aristolochia fimbriata]|uniref:Uncharacterized protein n=1 Tax=Aristolochia fimbriata TaxID=158543 RepID=A0AAV7F5U8_ARIFI|nr:hypothetical protein H6P81_000009 [Aristolochia fimbriata]
MPSPIFTKKLKESYQQKKGEESEEERDIEMEPTSEEKGTKQEQEGSIQEDFPLFGRGRKGGFRENQMKESTPSSNWERFALLVEEQWRGSQDEMKCFKFLFDAVTTDLTDQTIIKNPIGVQKVTKKVPRWSYKLTDEFEEEEQEEENEEETTEDPEIRSRKAKRVVIFNDNSENSDTDTSTSTSDNSNQAEEVALIRYSQQPDFRRDLIKGSMRAQRRKTTICEMFQGNDPLGSALQYDGAYTFFKDRIKVIREVSDSKTRHKKLPNSGINEWKDWLRGHHQYNLSQTRWSRLVPQNGEIESINAI